MGMFDDLIPSGDAGRPSRPAAAPQTPDVIPAQNGQPARITVRPSQAPRKQEVQADPTDAGMFSDLLPANTSFNELYPAEAFTPPAPDQAMATELRRAADERLVPPGSHEDDPVNAFMHNFANTTLLNGPRNLEAFVKSRQKGTTFDEEYEAIKAEGEALGRRYSKSSVGGTIAGAAAGAVVLPGIGGGATIAARAGRAAATGAAYGGLSELLDSKDPIKAGVAASLGFALGGVAAPVSEKIVGLVTKFWKAGGQKMVFLKPDGTLTDEAAKAARAAGIEPNDLQLVLARKYAEQFERKGATPASAKEAAADEFGLKLTPGEATDAYGVIAREQNMAKDVYGPLAGKEARKFYEGRGEAVERAKAGIQERVAGQQPLVSSVNDASNIAGAATRSAAGKAKGEYKAAYDDALGREGEFSDLAFRGIGERIRRDGLKGDNPVIINERTTPIAAQALGHLDANVNRMRVSDLAEPASREARTAGYVNWPGEARRVGGAVAPADDMAVGLNLRGVEQARKELVTFYKAAKASGNAEDLRAVRRIIAGFDDELETAMAVGLFKGDDGALPALKRARALFSDYQKTFRSQRPGDAVGKSMEKIVERDATGGDIANLIYGKAAIGEKGDSVHLAARLKQVLGPNSEEWSAVKQGLWLRLTSKPEGMDQFGPQALSQRILKFVNGDGADMAKTMFTPKELGEMRRFATVMKSIVPPPGTVNYSNTAYTIMREMALASGIGGGALWMTNDPVMASALASLKIGGKLGATIFRGRQATKHFAGGAPTAPVAPSRAQTAAGRFEGVRSGLLAGQSQE